MIVMNDGINWITLSNQNSHFLNVLVIICSEDHVSHFVIWTTKQRKLVIISCNTAMPVLIPDLGQENEYLNIRNSNNTYINTDIYIYIYMCVCIYIYVYTSKYVDSYINRHLTYVNIEQCTMAHSRNWGLQSPTTRVYRLRLPSVHPETVVYGLAAYGT